MLTPLNTKSIVPEADLIMANTGRFLAYVDNDVFVRVVACEDFMGDITGQVRPIGLDWKLTAILVILAFEASTEVLFTMFGFDRADVWAAVRKDKRYTAICNEFYHDEYGFVVVTYAALGKA